MDSMPPQSIWINDGKSWTLQKVVSDFISVLSVCYVKSAGAWFIASFIPLHCGQCHDNHGNIAGHFREGIERGQLP